VNALPLHPRHGPHRPASSTPSRQPYSVRRTATTDMLRPEGLEGRLLLVGRARDLTTNAQGRAEVHDSASLRAVVDYMGDRQIEEIGSDPRWVELDALVGRPVASGFRADVDQMAPGLAACRSPLHLLVDDLPVATLVSGYALSRAGAAHPRSGRHAARPDICAGWRTGGTIMTGIEDEGRVPVVTGPPAPVLPDPSDTVGWHPMPPIPPHGMRRWRRLDLIAGETLRIDAMFRDSHVDECGIETVVHEYALTGEIDRSSMRIISIGADPRVLPWTECPAAAPSAQRLVGRPVDDLRAWVRAELVGVTTCTHLNDMLRSLADIGTLADGFPFAPGTAALEVTS
jgi:hypothetical protein